MNVLIVEDDPDVRLLLQMLVSEEGHTSEVAVDGAAGLDAFRRFRPDLVLSDIKMPRMTGLQLLESIRAEDSDVLIVILTGSGSAEHAIQALRHGANNYIQKPIDGTDIIPILQKYAGVIQERTVDVDIHEMFVERAFTLELENSLEMIPKVADRLLRETCGAIKRADQLGVRLGLVELLLNAVEHGNLNISYEQKGESIETADGLETLCRTRLSDPELAARRVTIQFRMDATACEWVIADEGAGFDWKALPDPTGAGLLESHGRGILLSRTQFDTLEFQGRGNIVRAVKGR